MRGGGRPLVRWGAVMLLGLLSSCGLETVPYLPAPPVDAYTNQTDPTKLTLASSSVYTVAAYPDFQGYEIYYKIYPKAVNLSSNLAADVGRLATTPTRDYLVALGYQRMNGANDRSTPVPLVPVSPGSTQTIVLDFSSFLTQLSSQGASVTLSQPGSPVPQVTVGSTTLGVFRTVTTNTLVTYPYFNELYGPWTARASDMDASITKAPDATTPYEIDVFLVAYSFTPQNTTYSQPAPWGVLASLRP